MDMSVFIVNDDAADFRLSVFVRCRWAGSIVSPKHHLHLWSSLYDLV